MKIIGFLLLLFITACMQEETISFKEVVYDQTLYRIAEPYQPAVADNLVVHNYLNNYQEREVEKKLMQLSNNYFVSNNSYLQGGQFLDNEHLATLLSDDYLNDSEKMQVGEESFATNFIVSLKEYNFLAGNGDLKGISLAVVVNPYQVYQVDVGSQRHQKVTIDDDYLTTVKQNLLDYLFAEFSELKDKRIVIGFFELPSPQSRFPGNFSHVVDVFNGDSALQELAHQYYDLQSQTILNKDLDNYNFYQEVLALQSKYTDIDRITNKGLYFNHQPHHLSIEIKGVYFPKERVLYFSELIAELVKKNNFQCAIDVIIESSFGREALITKEKDFREVQINILRR